MSFLFDWMRQLLHYLGATNRNNITSYLLSLIGIMNLEAKMLFLGLDNAGKVNCIAKIEHIL